MQFLVLGAVFTLIGLVAARVVVGVIKQERQLAGASKVPGEVVDFEQREVTRRSNNGGRRRVTQYFPVVSFRTVEGREIRHASQYAWKGQVGQQVEVEYAADDPTLFRIAGNNVGVVGIAVGGGVGGLFLILGIVFLVVGIGAV